MPGLLVAGAAVAALSCCAFAAGLATGAAALSPLYLCLGALLLPAAVVVYATAADPARRGDGEIYDLSQGRLNLELPPQSMWMNMGFWDGTHSSFPSACRALLLETLGAAGLLHRELEPGEPRPSDSRIRPLRIVDLGFGCGDQTICLTQLAAGVRSAERTAREDHPSSEAHDGQLLIQKYIGLEQSAAHFDFAHQRLKQLGLLGAPSTTGQSSPTPDVQIFHADAASPSSWSAALHAATLDQPGPRNADADAAEYETWVLGLDTLYHFHPSRAAVLRHAHDALHAHVMAFDLLLAGGPAATAAQRAVLWLVARGMGVPAGNFLTPAQYTAQLAAAGYAEGAVEIRDVSAQVFAPLVAFLERRDGALRALGGGLGKLRVAKWVFGWFARSGVVRGCIVVARR